jgi:hypothetical protein
MPPVNREELVKSLNERILLLLECQHSDSAKKTMAQTVAQTIELLADVMITERFRALIVREDIPLSVYREILNAKGNGEKAEEKGVGEGTEGRS